VSNTALCACGCRTRAKLSHWSCPACTSLASRRESGTHLVLAPIALTRRTSHPLLQQANQGSDEVVYGLWIVFLGMGLSATLASLGVHWLLSHSVLWFSGAIWSVFNVPLSEFFRSLFFTAEHFFFKVCVCVCVCVCALAACSVCRRD
jgi:hypothetical protein